MNASLAIALLVAAGTAHADDVNAGADARSKALFDEGKTLFAEGRYGAACEKLDASYKLNRLSSTRGLLAACFEKIGKLASAWVAYRDSAAIAAKQGRTERAQAAREKAAELEPKLAWLTLDAAAAVKALPAVKLTIDGVEQPHGSLTSAIPVDGGQHLVEASAPDHRPWRTTIEIQDAERQTAVVPPLEEDPTRRLLLQQRLDDDRRVTRRRKHIAYGLMAGGGASMLVATTLGVLAYRQWNRATDAGCTRDGRCPTSEAADEVDGASLRGDLATYVGAAGLALAGAGIFVYVTSPKPRTEAELRMLPSMGPGVAGMVLEGRF